MRVLFLVPVCLLAACSGDDSAPSRDLPPSGDPPPPSGSVIRDIRCEPDVLAGKPFGGLFTGEIAGSGGSAWALALLTEDGYFRLHIEDSLGDGAPEFQFVGQYRGTTDNPWAWGEFRLQNCSDSAPFCFASEGQFELTSLCAGELKGSLVAYPEGRPFPTGWDMLSFTLDPPVGSAYDTPATLAFSEGVYDGSYPYNGGAGPLDVWVTAALAHTSTAHTMFTTSRSRSRAAGPLLHTSMARSRGWLPGRSMLMMHSPLMHCSCGCRRQIRWASKAPTLR
jgi:hypothetical protein